jgi:hypothetical protein
MRNAHQMIDDLNYYSDPRVSARRDEKPILILPDGVEFKLPTKWEVCGLCDGEGKHVNPSIDAGGLSAEDFAEDPDFAEEYASGTYDVWCARCAGRTTERVVDVDALSDEHRKLYEQSLRDEAIAQREEAYERAFAC